MTKEEMTELFEKAKAKGQPIVIGQYNEGNGFYVENVYAQSSSGSESKSENVSDFEPFVASAPFGDEISYPDSPLAADLFNKALKMDKVKQALGALVSAKRDKGEFKIVHWFIVWKVFRRYRFIPNDKTQIKFIQWAKNVFGWDWKTMDFKATVPETLKRTPLDEWTGSNLSSQRPQADEYLAWRDKLIDTFLDEEMSGKRNCKERFYMTWFDTDL